MKIYDVKLWNGKEHEESETSRLIIGADSAAECIIELKSSFKAHNTLLFSSEKQYSEFKLSNLSSYPVPLVRIITSIREIRTTDNNYPLFISDDKTDTEETSIFRDSSLESFTKAVKNGLSNSRRIIIEGNEGFIPRTIYRVGYEGDSEIGFSHNYENGDVFSDIDYLCEVFYKISLGKGFYPRRIIIDEDYKED